MNGDVHRCGPLDQREAEGGGVTEVAAQDGGDRREVDGLGFQSDPDRVRAELDGEGGVAGVGPFQPLGDCRGGQFAGLSSPRDSRSGQHPGGIVLRYSRFRVQSRLESLVRQDEEDLVDAG